MFDDWFETVTAPRDELLPNWSDVAIHNHLEANFNDDLAIAPPLSSEWDSVQHPPR